MKVGKIRINMIENDSYFDKENAFANVGESIQAVTMSYIYEKIGICKDKIVKVDQCKIKEYDGEPLIFPLRLPLSKATVDNFLPLKECITPIFMSLHLHDDILSGREDLIAYFKKYEPVGCRDEQTCCFFRQHGIEAYIMGCYTVCLPKREKEPVKGSTFLVDVSKELMEKIPSAIKRNAVILSQAVPFEEYPVTHQEDERLEKVAEFYLDRYYNEADLVITSRLHAASPCMAMGIPVILASNNIDFRYAWIDKYLKLYQQSEYSMINWNPGIVEMDEVKELMLNFYRESIINGIPAKEYLQKLDEFYRNRNKTAYYLCFRERLTKLKEKYSCDDAFDYAIWGAGCHAIFAHDLMSEMFPNAKLIVVIDKYKKGKIFGVPIVRGEDLDQYKVEHVCITTNPGLNEAIEGCNIYFGNDAKYKYTIMTSQQKS